MTTSIWCAHQPWAFEDHNHCDDGPAPAIVPFIQPRGFPFTGKSKYTSATGVTHQDMAGILNHDQVLVICSYTRGAFLISEAQRRVGLTHLRYSPALYHIADQVQAKLGLPNGYTAVQWRTETVAVYLPCALYLMKHFGPNTLLISDISFDPKTVLWGGMAHHSGSVLQQQASLKMLMAKGFHKMDESSWVRDNFHDIGMLSVIDKILGLRASRFVTCIDKHSKVCNMCMRTSSNFAREIIAGRQSMKKPASTSWERPNEAKYSLAAFEGPGCSASIQNDTVLSVCDGSSWANERPFVAPSSNYSDAGDLDA